VEFTIVGIFFLLAYLLIHISNYFKLFLRRRRRRAAEIKEMQEWLTRIKNVP
jgi:preprotein translocase subunit YajC